MGTITIKVPQNLEEEYKIDNSKIIMNLLKYFSYIELKSKMAENDTLLGLFSDKPDLINEITESAIKENRGWSSLSLLSAMQDMEYEDTSEYNLSDLKEKFL